MPNISVAEGFALVAGILVVGAATILVWWSNGHKNQQQKFEESRWG